jgi:hypothetical protein
MLLEGILDAKCYLICPRRSLYLRQKIKTII